MRKRYDMYTSNPFSRVKVRYTEDSNNIVKKSIDMAFSCLKMPIYGVKRYERKR